MKICVVGSGYVGLVTGACLADFGNHVVGVDKDERKVEALRGGRIPIFEPGLDAMVQEEHGSGPAHLHHRAWPGDRGGPGRIHRGGHAAAARRSRRPHLHSPGRRVDRQTPERLQGDHHQKHGPDRYRQDGGRNCRRQE